MSRSNPVPSFLLAFLFSTMLLAEDLQVNTYTTGRQVLPDIAKAPNGSFVVAWQSYGSPGTDSYDWSIQHQLFTPNGLPVGGQLQVNTYTNNFQAVPSASMGANGHFVIIWYSQANQGTDNAPGTIRGRLYTIDGSATDEFQVNSYTTNHQYLPSVSMNSAGDFVVVWTSLFGSPGNDTYLTSVQGRVFSSAGIPITSDFQVNTYTTGRQRAPVVAQDSSGDFVVVWFSEESQGGAGGYVVGQRFVSNGSAAGEEFTINIDPTADTFPSVSTMPNDDFIVVWTSSVNSGVFGRRYSSLGIPYDDPFQIDTYTASIGQATVASSGQSGDFLVAWQSASSPGSDTFDTSIQARLFSSDGSPLNDQYQVNVYTVGDQIEPSLAADDLGNFVVAWGSEGSDGTDTSLTSIQMADQFEVLFFDGFESGDPSAWSDVIQ